MLRPGETAYAERFYVVSFYLREALVKFLPLEQGVPSDARWLFSGHGLGEPLPRYPGFHLTERFAGRDLEMLLYKRDEETRGRE